MMLMKHFFILIFYFLRALAMLVKPGGKKSLVAENIMLRTQATHHSKSPPKNKISPKYDELHPYRFQH